MFNLSAILLTSIVFLCSMFSPSGYVNEEKQQAAEEIYYFDTVYANEDVPMAIDTSTITINYITKTLLSSHSLAMRCPHYTYAPAEGACAAVAAGNLIGYYDRFDEELIPNHKSGNPFSNSYLYSSTEDEEVCAVIDKLCDYILEGGYGATESQFISGLTKFCNEKGKNISFSSCMQNGSFSYSTAQTYLDAGLPIALFLSGYNVGDLLSSENADTISYYTSSANHIMIGFGYKEFYYVTSGGDIHNQYISVSSGLIQAPTGIFNIDYQTQINDALAVNIY